MPASVAMPAVRQNRSKLAPTCCQASSTIAAGTTPAAVVDFVMALLSVADSAPRAYRLKVGNAYLTFSTSTGTFPRLGDVPQSSDMVKNIVVIAIRLAAGVKESAIDHVVDEDPGGGQGVLLVWLTVAVFISVEAAGAALPGDAGRGCFHQALPFCVGPRRRGEGLGQPLDDIAAIFRRNDVDEVPPSRREVQIGA